MVVVCWNSSPASRPLAPPHRCPLFHPTTLTSVSPYLYTSLRMRCSSSSPSSTLSVTPPLRYAVLGAGFAGLSVAWHLLRHFPEEIHATIDIFDESGVGGGASGVAGGLLHPYSPKVKLLWRGADCWRECLNLLSIAETAIKSRNNFNSNPTIIHRRGILRPAMDAKNLETLAKNAENCLPNCRIQTLDRDAAENLVPNLSVPFGSAFYMPEALNVHPLQYLQICSCVPYSFSVIVFFFNVVCYLRVKALYLACEDLVEQSRGTRELNLYKNTVHTLLGLEEYDAVVICLGAKADLVSELSGKLPLRMCRGVIAHLQLPDNVGETYPDRSPSILSDAWLAVQGPRDVLVGSTWDWHSRNYSKEVSEEEASIALEKLLPKASALYPRIKGWSFIGARAGLRAMPPITSDGSLPLLGRVDHLVGGDRACKYWFFGGLGARGLLYHGLLGKLMAQAVIHDNEDLFPTELTSWKRMKAIK